MKLKQQFFILAGILFISLFLSEARAETTLDSVRKRGYLLCGVSTGVPGFSVPDQSGSWRGFDTDFCRAVAAVTLGDSAKVRFIPLTIKERFNALRDGTVDVLFRNSTWTLTRDTSLGLSFAGITYFDGQGFMVKKNRDIASARELDDVSVCVKEGTTSEANLTDFFTAHNKKYSAVVLETTQTIAQAFEAGRCDVLSSDRSQLLGLKSRLSEPDSVQVLPDVISKEPLGPVVRERDLQWLRIIKWMLAVMVNAEELNVSSSNIVKQLSSTDPDVRYLLAPEIPESLGLNSMAAFQVLDQVGHYGEVFARNLGSESPLNIERGLNNLWSHGGILYAPPLR